MFRAGGQLPNFYDKATAMIVRFECKPQRFLKTGEIPIEYTPSDFPNTESYTITNHTNYLALPEIKVIGGFVSIEIANGVHSSTISLTDQTIVKDIIIDSEIQDVYTPDEFINNKIQSINGFPKLYPGINTIKINYLTENSKVLIKPRWWVL